MGTQCSVWHCFLTFSRAFITPPGVHDFEVFGAAAAADGDGRRHRFTTVGKYYYRAGAAVCRTKRVL